MAGINEVVLDSGQFDSEMDWARSLLTKHRAEITLEFRELLVVALEPGVEFTYTPDAVASGAVWRIVVRSKLSPQLVALLSTLGAGQV